MPVYCIPDLPTDKQLLPRCFDVPYQSSESQFKDKNWYLTNRLTVHGGGYFPVSDVVDCETFHFIHRLRTRPVKQYWRRTGIECQFRQYNPTNVYVGSWLRLNDAVIPYVGLEIAACGLAPAMILTSVILKALYNQPRRILRSR